MGGFPVRIAGQARRWRGAISTLAVLAYLAAALYPFDVRLRKAQPNAAERTGSGAIAFHGPGLAHTSVPPAWLGVAIRNHSLAVRTEFQCANETQSGPARIFTISENKGARNLTIGQDGTTLVVRLRHSATSHNGIPAIVVPGSVRAGVWHTVRVEIAADRAEVFLDGRSVATRAFVASPFDTWNPHCGAAIGNEWSLWRAWCGTVRALEIEVAGGTLDLLADADLTIPAELSYVGAAFRSATTTREAFYSEPRDVAQNVLGFLPIGLLLAWLYPRSRRAWLIFAILGLSVTMESVQLLAPSRKTSPTDLATNLLGGGVGLAIGTVWMTRRSGAGSGRRSAGAVSPAMSDPSRCRERIEQGRLREPPYFVGRSIDNQRGIR